MTTVGRRSAVQETENALTRAAVLFRAAGLLEITLIWIASLVSGMPGAGTAGFIAAAAVAESVPLCVLLLRRGRLQSGWVTVDLTFLVGLLITDGAVGHTGRIYFTFSYSIIASVAFGVTFRTVRAVLAGTAALALGYLVQELFRHSEPAPNLIIDMLTYVPNTTVAWAVARRMRDGGRMLDASRDQIAQLAAQRERDRHARMLHDHVLQTLETLVRRDVIGDRELAGAVAADAVWLRSLVEGSQTDGSGDLLGRLQAVIQRKTAAGLRIEFNALGLVRQVNAGPPMPQATVDALADAVGEALTNVGKHAGCPDVVVHADRTGQAVVISVIDHGHGFDPLEVTARTGMLSSIIGRIQEVGGRACITSAPTAGTQVELTVPATAWQADTREGVNAPQTG